MVTNKRICIPNHIIAVLTLFAVSILLMTYFPPVTAQSLVPGIHGMSIVQGVRFNSMNVTGEKEIMFNIKYLWSGSSPPVLIVATALTSGTDNRPDASKTMIGSQILDAGWNFPKV
jgi:hypothetical protein